MPAILKDQRCQISVINFAVLSRVYSGESKNPRSSFVLFGGEFRGVKGSLPALFFPYNTTTLCLRTYE
jgi:hypothetical protein